jgi:hypothetical protein
LAEQLRWLVKVKQISELNTVGQLRKNSSSVKRPVRIVGFLYLFAIDFSYFSFAYYLRCSTPKSVA